MIIYTINAVSEETGIHPSSLRRWETMGFIAPGRIDFGRHWIRIYQDWEIDHLKRVKDYLDDGYTLRGAFDKAREDMNKEG